MTHTQNTLVVRRPGTSELYVAIGVPDDGTFRVGDIVTVEVHKPYLAAAEHKEDGQ